MRENDLVLLITPLEPSPHPIHLLVEAVMLWNRPGELSVEGDALIAELPGKTLRAYPTHTPVRELNVPARAPFLAFALEGEIGISTGARRTLEEIRAIVEARRAEHLAYQARYGHLAEVYAAMQSCMGWDTIYEPEKDRMVTPVSRVWNNNWGGYVLFCWDTYFAALMASLDNKELAYSNAIEITREKTEDGFVPNFAAAGDLKSRDRSQPPVGSLAVRQIYRRYRETWFVREVFDDLLTWNRWWDARRQVMPGLLAWGSQPFMPRRNAAVETEATNKWQGAAFESGLDNSPMYDDIPFDTERHLMLLADVGLTALYVCDCECLAELAETLGRAAEAAELRARQALYASGLRSLWSERHGIFLNQRADTGQFETRLSPTNFYPLLTDVPTPAQARRMVDEHFYNPDEFWGEWMLPSIARNDPAYPEQRYWRGKVWAPMNYLVYLGLRRHGLKDACRDLAEKSAALLLREWREHGHVHENYTCTTGWGCDKPDSDRFYHWGGLLGLIALTEAGYMD
ncbi:MAG: trehalase family glycosidase [Anaerolineales bacterium]|nr:trehalase family glycosidase [Anaerolineales bacterium]